MLSPEQGQKIADKLDLAFKQVGYGRDGLSIYAKDWRKLPFNKKCPHRYIAKSINLHATIKKRRLESCAKRKVGEGYVPHGASLPYREIIHCANPSCGLVFSSTLE
jgi:hypothetical protein